MAASNINVVVDHREPDPGPRAAQHRRRAVGLQAARGRQQPPQGPRAASGSTSRTTSTSPSSAAQGENCANYLSKGRPVAVEGRLEWSEWEASDGSGKRSKVEIIANSVQFLGSRDDNPDGNGNGGGFQPQSDVPADTSDFEPRRRRRSGVGAGDDIPF